MINISYLIRKLRQRLCKHEYILVTEWWRDHIVTGDMLVSTYYHCSKCKKNKRSI